jgi:hypothetical protein
MAKSYPDEGTFPSSGGEVLDRAGIKDTGYLDKKGTPEGQRVDPSGISGHIFNQLPPGDNIADQMVADVKGTDSMKVKKVTDLGYPGDGWT